MRAQLMQSAFGRCATLVQQQRLGTQAIMGTQQALHTVSSSSEREQQQPVQTALPTFSSILAPRSRALCGPSAALAQQASTVFGAQTTFTAGMASSAPNSSVTDENTWAKFRAEAGVEKKNTVSQAFYAMILVFGFGATMTDIYAYPPRVLAVGFVLWALMYVRK